MVTVDPTLAFQHLEWRQISVKCGAATASHAITANVPYPDIVLVDITFLLADGILRQISLDFRP